MFLAGKSEDSFVNIKDLFRIYNKISEERILACEIVLLEVCCNTDYVAHSYGCSAEFGAVFSIWLIRLVLFAGLGLQLESVPPAELRVLDHCGREAAGAAVLQRGGSRRAAGDV
jgi:hypothetical protein